MLVSSREICNRYGISVRKLEKMSRRKDCPEGFTDNEGRYEPELVEDLLARMAKNAMQVKAKRLAKEQATCSTEVKKKPRKYTRRKSIIQGDTSKKSCKETLEEFELRFWRTDDLWQEFVTNSASEELMRYFVRQALKFGYTAAYPE